MELHELSALEIEAAYRSGEATPTELVDHLLERIAGEEVGAPSSP